MADRKISDLTALTTPASGDYLPIVDISETAASSKNKRITIEELFRGVPLGTAAAPSIAIEGDENTGIYSPGADQLALATGGSGRLFVDSSGNVGVGSVPSSALDVNGVITVRNGGAIRGLIGAPAGDFTYISLQNGALANSFVNSAINQNLTGFTTVNAAPGQQLALRIGNDDAIRIDSSKRVGIGTTSPGCELEIGGNGHIHLADQGRVGCNSGSGEPNDAYVKFYDSDIIGFHTTDTERARITSDGKLGLGISSPQGRFHIGSLGVITAPTYDVSGAFAGIVLNAWNKDVGSNFEAVGDIIAWSDKQAGARPSQLRFFTAPNSTNAIPTQRMVIDSAGRVGIGVAAPSSLLHLADAGDITVGTTTGTKIGTATTQKLGFYNATPVVQPAAVADATDATTVITQLNDLLAKLRTLGLIAT